jgi:hypothetical protein
MFNRQNYDQRNYNYRQQPNRFDGSVRTSWTYRGNGNSEVEEILEVEAILITTGDGYNVSFARILDT